MNPSRTTTPIFSNTLLAAVQMVSGPDVEENLSEAEQLLTNAAERGAKLIVLPEYFPLIGNQDSDKLKIREEFGAGPIQQFLSQQAKDLRIWLIGGSIPLLASDPDKVLNTTLVHDPTGRCVARYDKIHLFSYNNDNEHYEEGDTIEAGTQPVAFQTPFGRVGLSICYDLRFPELYRQLSRPQELDLIVLPAAFTATTGQSHWEILLRARAIENQCYLLAAAQGGRHPNGRRTYGNSMIIDPWGTIVDRIAEGKGIITGLLDHAHLSRIRNSMPVQSHRVLPDSDHDNQAESIHS